MKEIRFAMIGFGNIAKTHMTALRALPIVKQLPVVPVLDTLVTRSPERHAAQAAAIGFRNVTDSIMEAAADPQVDVFDICTPNARHLEDAEAAVSHLKGIYCEKPLADTYERSAALVQLTETQPQLPYQLAFTFRYHPAVMRIRELVREGIIGDILQCKISYRRSGYLNPERPVSWRLESGMSGGGAITDLGVHVLDMIRHWFGDFASVKGEALTFVGERKAASGEGMAAVDVDDWAIMHYQTQSGIRGMAEVSRIAYGSDAFDIQIVGSKGSITCDLERQAVPAVHLLSGGTPALPVPATLALLPDEKATMGFAVDTHFAALHHYVLRCAGEDRFAELAPTLQDGLAVEYWIDQVLKGRNC
ncbi:gfo/Idh/MocA family oxidoreductase [Paenibacillus sambharensis]|uniref:Gfo/Idh/MocA family oxidoreductase n=1 Tax=Paenibacillus sambharensis TaxID=1803190 RepID=A0A2W1LPA4_9BACL|nr:Gfo/Idh/MocA family oxidoreductase [Paenibacillus sambharensis]PZD93661.1 gfo/Idh/MocA family oxidoreductase [Paenibacillus sambharensis]